MNPAWVFRTGAYRGGADAGRIQLGPPASRWAAGGLAARSIALLAGGLVLAYVDRQVAPTGLAGWDFSDVFGNVVDLAVPIVGFVLAYKRPANPVASNPGVHQSWPRPWTSVSSTSHPSGWPSPTAGTTTGPLGRENRLIRRLLHTGRPPAGRCCRVGRADGKGPLLPGLQAPAGTVCHLQDSRAPAVGLHLQCPAPRTFTDSRGNGGSRR
jgi:hypothetical protein